MGSKEQSANFIEQDLLPEMVYNRCFCDPGSREFVEFESAIVKPIIKSHRSNNFSEIYRVNAVIRFSGIPRSFPLIVKLLSDGSEYVKAFDAFQNEEMFYSKMTQNYGTDFIPKCYLSDLGRYGRPVIVLEDLEEQGYQIRNNKLDEDHLRLCMKTLGTIHGKGLKLKAEKFNSFREFHAKLLEISFDDESLKHYEQRISRALKLIGRRHTFEDIKNTVGSDIADLCTLCHGHFSRDNLLFKYESEKPVDIKVIDWQTMRYSSPSIDLGPILLENLACQKLNVKVQEMLTLYIDAVKQEYSDVTCERLKKDIMSKLPLSCLILFCQENTVDKELPQILRQLDRLDAFD